tara:strand:+ start:7042 stop:7575 length:534 start_codon:yes stop_codon:yes gene_type:complete
MDTKKVLAINDKVKISGGKYKAKKGVGGVGVLKSLKNTYCDVEFPEGNINKVKIDYIHRLEEGVIEMPDINQLDPKANDKQFEDFEVLDNIVAEVEDKIDNLLEKLSPDEQEQVEEEEEQNDIEFYKKGCYHWECEYHVALAERDQADCKVNEQEDECVKLRKRCAYLESICHKLLN